MSIYVRAAQQTECGPVSRGGNAQADKAPERSAAEGWKIGMTLPSRGKPLKWKAAKRVLLILRVPLQQEFKPPGIFVPNAQVIQS